MQSYKKLLYLFIVMEKLHMNNDLNFYMINKKVRNLRK